MNEFSVTANMERMRIDAEPQDEFVSLITTVSWEPRFIHGFNRLLKRFRARQVILLRYREWEDWTYEANAEATALCRSQEIPHELVALSYDRPGETWRNLGTSLAKLIPSGGRVLVDISTMPREAIWSAFFFLENMGVSVIYAYHRPVDYDHTWLSRDPQKPRFPFQMSGEARFGRDTVLLVTTGFDTTRTEQLMQTYEPAHMLMAFQEGEQFHNLELNVEAHYQLEKQLDSKLHDRQHIRSFPINAYSEDHGRAILELELAPYFESGNILMTSLGPKLSAVALYKIHRAHPETALVYAPSAAYNRAYSVGIGETEYGSL